MNLHFFTEQPHHIDVETNFWSDQHDDTDQCIALVLDGLNDHRTPVLTPAEARHLAMQLIVTAQQIESSQ